MAVADFFKQVVPGAGPSQLEAMAPLALGLLGPIGGAVGVLGALYQRGRQEKAGQEAYGAMVGGAGENLAAQPLEGLLGVAGKMAAKGMAVPDIIQDRIDELQAERASGQAYLRQLALQQLGDQAAMQRVEKQGEQQMAYGETVAQRERSLAEYNAGERRRLAELESDLRTKEATGGTGGRLGTIGTGMQRVVDAAGNVREVPVPGSAEYAKRVQPIMDTQRGLNLVQRMIQEIDQTGGDFYGARSKRQNLIFQQVVSVLGTLANAGVLQEGEAERYLSAVGDPTSIGSRFRTAEQLKEPYKELERTLLKRQGALYDVLTGEVIPPMVGLPEDSAEPPPPPGYR